MSRPRLLDRLFPKKAEIMKPRVPEEPLQKQWQSKWTPLILQTNLIEQGFKRAVKDLLPTRDSDYTLYLEDYTPKANVEILVNLLGPADLIECVLRAPTNNYSITPEKDRRPLYRTKGPLTFVEWSAISPHLAKVGAFEDQNNMWVFTVNNLNFRERFKLFILNGTTTTFSQIICTWRPLSSEAEEAAKEHYQ